MSSLEERYLSNGSESRMKHVPCCLDSQIPVVIKLIYLVKIKYELNNYLHIESFFWTIIWYMHWVFLEKNSYYSIEIDHKYCRFYWDDWCENSHFFDYLSYIFEDWQYFDIDYDIIILDRKRIHNIRISSYLVPLVSKYID